jgi:beta-glucanase (GH16 family)
MVRIMFSFKRRMCAVALAAAACVLGPSASTAQKTPWVLAWSDEFNGVDGSQPDPAKWELMTAGHGFGNKELEYYTPRKENIHLEKGNLVITARKETMTDAEGVEHAYTSGRLQTKGLFAQKYGRFEARIRIPKGQGIWPAFWMLGDDHDTAQWPECGEIDVMEVIGKEPGNVYGTLHGPGYSGAHPLSEKLTLPAGQEVGDAFHIFAVEWESDAVRFYVDDTLYATQTKATIPAGTRWVYDHPFYLLLNVAVGGTWPSYPDATTKLPVSMLVDYVRVYTAKQ